MALLGQPRLQLLDLGGQFLDLRLQLRDLAHPRPQHGILRVPCGAAVVWRHALMLRLQRKSAGIVPSALFQNTPSVAGTGGLRRKETPMLDLPRGVFTRSTAIIALVCYALTAVFALIAIYGPVPQPVPHTAFPIYGYLFLSDFA